MLNYWVIGSLLGLSAGLAPGPLLALVISETMRHDVKSGIKVALVPIITDAPIIILSLFILKGISNFQNILGVVSLIGGVYISLIGYESIRSKGVDLNQHETKPKSLRKGIIANALSPHPYIFWISVGSPIVTKAAEQSVVAPLAFIGCFYVLLVGSKIVLAILVGKSKTFLSGGAYKNIMRLLGLLLCALAVTLFVDGLKLLNFL